METIYLPQLTQFISAFGFMFILLFNQGAHAKQDLIKSRLVHAKELMGSNYSYSVVKKTEGAKHLPEFVFEVARKFLPQKEKFQARKVSQALLQASEQYSLDPVFLMAVIQNESSFNPKQVGQFGEIGLMQIKPDTAAWISKLYDLPYQNKKSLYQVDVNIKIGAALLDKLRHQFDSQSHLYVSAYNLGAKKVRQMVSNERMPREYMQAVMKRYLAFNSGFKEKGSPQLKSNVAWSSTLMITQKISYPKRVPSSSHLVKF